jgi:hypothetical protein
MNFFLNSISTDKSIDGARICTVFSFTKKCQGKEEHERIKDYHQVTGSSYKEVIRNITF